MDKDIITLAVSISSVLVSVATFSVAYSQMKIAGAKTKLDLYNKRFNVYVSALDYYQATWNKSHEIIKEKSIEFTKTYRESKFLFESKDGIYETLGKIQQNGAVIHAYEQRKYESDKVNAKNQPDLNVMHELSVKARCDFEENLKTLEKQIEKYIQFVTIYGWKFLN